MLDEEVNARTLDLHSNQHRDVLSMDLSVNVQIETPMLQKRLQLMDSHQVDILYMARFFAYQIHLR